MHADAEPSSDKPNRPPQLLAIELRVLGALMEKELTTTDAYPLTVNSIITACNQKSSRDPVTSYQQGEIRRSVRGRVSVLVWVVVWIWLYDLGLHLSLRLGPGPGLNFGSSPSSWLLP